MTLRLKLMVAFSAIVVVSVTLVAVLVNIAAVHAYDRAEGERSALLAEQVRQQFARRLVEVAERVAELARQDSTVQLAIAMSRNAPDYSQFADAAERLNAPGLDVLELLTPDGAIIASKHWPARFGYQEEWFAGRPATAEGNAQGAFLQSLDFPAGPALAIIAVRQMQLGQHVFYIAGGQRLDEHFVQSFAEPMGMRTTLYWQPSPASENVVLGDERESTAAGQESLRRLLERVRNTGAATSETLERKVAGGALEEAAHAFPLLDRQQRVAAVLLVSSSREAVDALERRIRWIAMAVSAAGILLGLLISAALAARVTRPVEELGKAADEVASGNLNIRVDDSRQDELGRLAYAFNRMTRELLESHEKLVQSERVAAWRELARRLAHELKNPLFPLQITVENLLRAKEQTPEQFDEVFRESGQTLQAEIGNLKGIIDRFSDFSKMPTPELQPISVNESLRQAARVYEPQFCAKGRPLITARYDLDKALEQKSVQADFELLQRALTNLISNAVEAMPEGGYMTLRSRDDGDTVRLEVSDTGGGISKEESSRLFTPYYTSKAHGTGLGLAIAQSVVSDHGGKIWAQSEEQKGTTFVIRLPKNGARRP